MAAALAAEDTQAVAATLVVGTQVVTRITPARVIIIMVVGTMTIIPMAMGGDLGSMLIRGGGGPIHRTRTPITLLMVILIIHLRP